MSEAPQPPPPPPPIPPSEPTPSSTKTHPPEQVGGMDANIAAALAYFFIVGIVWLVLEPYNKNKFVRFHAIQALGLGVLSMGLSMVLGGIPVLGWIALILLSPVLFIVWLICAVKAFQYEWFKLPVIGDFAEQQANKMS